MSLQSLPLRVQAVAAPLPVAELAQAAGRAAYPYRVLTGERLTQLLGGAAPFTDAESEESPAPPAGRSFFG